MKIDMKIEFIPFYEDREFIFVFFGIIVDIYNITIVIFNIEIEVKRRSR